MGKISRTVMLGLLFVRCAFVLAQTPPIDSYPKTAESMYQALSTVGLDVSRVFSIRGASLDRGPIHITLEDGTIAFTKDVAGRVTGAFFEGEGEVLLVPPNQTERSSMAMFTGAAILEERFGTAYFRFNDKTFTQFAPALQPAEGAQEFVTQWNDAAVRLAEGDGLRLLVSLSHLLPSSGSSSQGSKADADAADDQMLHARLQGRKLGNFDLYFDTMVSEQIWAGQLKAVEGGSYYNVWTSFPLPSRVEHPEELTGIGSQQGKPDLVSVSTYKIQATVQPPTTLNAEASLQLEAGKGGDRTVLFELSRFLQIKQVEADGHPVEFIHNQALEGTQLARRGNDLVALVFPEPLVAGQKLNLHFVYGGEVLSEAGGGLLYVGARGTWYPNRGLSMANFDLEFHYPSGWTLVATGKPLETQAPPSNPQNPGMVTSRWVSDRPIPVAGFNLGKYSRAVANAGEIPVEAYAASAMERGFPRGQAEIVVPEAGPPHGKAPAPIAVLPPLPSPAKTAQTVADRGALAVDSFSKYFGPYPYSQLALTQMPGDLSQGWPGLIFLSSVAFLNPTEQSRLRMSPVEKSQNEGVVAHETAHQWWGDLVVWSGYRDQWIVEGLANYSSLMLLQAEDPQRFRQVMDKYRSDLLQKNKEGVALMEAGPVTLGTRLTSSLFPGGYEAISYGRGTWLFHMLRTMMQEAEQRSSAHGKAAASADIAQEPFFRALRALRTRYEGKSVGTRELMAAFENELPHPLWYEGKKSLDWFYNSWINGSAIPRLELQNVKYADAAGSTVVTGAVLQQSASKDFVTAVPIYASVAGRPVFLGHVFADGPETRFRVTAPAGTRRLLLDPNQSLLLRPH